MKIEGHGIRAALPAGWEGAIGRRASSAALAAGGKGAIKRKTSLTVPSTGLRAAATTGSAPTGELSLPTAHLATVALPPVRGDFGSGAVDLLGRDDAFVALVEYGPECVDTAMFPTAGIPRRPTPQWFNRRALQRAIDGQTGFQRFFSHRNRAFCLYVVLGRDASLDPVVARVRAALRGIEVAPG